MSEDVTEVVIKAVNSRDIIKVVTSKTVVEGATESVV